LRLVLGFELVPLGRRQGTGCGNLRHLDNLFHRFHYSVYGFYLDRRFMRAPGPPKEKDGRKARPKECNKDAGLPWFINPKPPRKTADSGGYHAVVYELV
jgi:hypothetical protein